MSGVFLGTTPLADEAVETALVCRFIGPVTGAVIHGAPLALAVSVGNSEAGDRPEYWFR